MKNIVITGSTKGIGLAMAYEFLNYNCCVTLSGRSEHLSDDAVKQLEKFKDKYIYVSCDVTQKDNIQRLWDLSIKHWGKIDIWINNAGQNSQRKFTWEIDTDDTKAVFETNLLGVIYGCQVASKEMIAQKYGAIYSMEGLGSNNMIQSKTIHYGTSKHALTYYMKGLAKELKGTNVISGRLSPGMMLTDFITKDKSGKPSDVITDQSFIKIFNILADKPETVAHFFVKEMLKNTKNNAQITWLTNRKTVLRFISSGFNKRKLLD